jgi:hypothetical protein
VAAWRQIVGAGDLKPESDTGKVIAVVVMLVGIGFVAVLSAIRPALRRPCRGARRDEQADLHAKLDAVAARLERRTALDERP